MSAKDPNEPVMAAMECEEDQASAPRSEALGSATELVCSPGIRNHRATECGKATRSAVVSEEDAQECWVPCESLE